MIEFIRWKLALSPCCNVYYGQNVLFVHFCNLKHLVGSLSKENTIRYIKERLEGTSFNAIEDSLSIYSFKDIDYTNICIEYIDLTKYRRH